MQHGGAAAYAADIDTIRIARTCRTYIAFIANIALRIAHALFDIRIYASSWRALHCWRRAGDACVDLLFNNDYTIHRIISIHFIYTSYITCNLQKKN